MKFEFVVPEGERFPNWNNLYKINEVESMPWFHEEIDNDLKTELEQRNLNRGKFIDIGTGPGTQAAQIAQMGFDVTGTDLSEDAILKAQTRFDKSSISFLQDDILNSKLIGPFDYAFDRGCFHVLKPQMRDQYVATLTRILSPKGILFLKCFSTDEPEVGWGPWRFAKEDIAQIFVPYFQVESITPTVYQGTMESHPKALFCVLRRSLVV